MIVDLSNKVAFAPPWFDRHGLFHWQTPPSPMVDPPTVPAYEAGGRMVADSILRSNDIVAAPNDFATVDSGTDRLRIGRYQLPADAPHSYANRGFRIGMVETSQGFESQAQADRAAFIMARQRGRAHEVLTFTSTADPRHDTYDIVPALSETWLEMSWSLECRSGGPMQHTLRRVSYAAGS
jgi:hypothetical protein